jgi:hypothetical protein
MTRPRSAWLHYSAAVSMVAMVSAFWLWVLTVGRLNIETRGFGGSVTATLWTLYLFGVPVAGFAALITGFRDAKRRRLPRRLAAVIGVVVAVTLVFWWWSITRAGG